MKAKLNLSIDSRLLVEIKRYARAKRNSISSIVETYFRTLGGRPLKRKNIIEMVEKLKKPDIPSNMDLKKEFYEDRETKR